MNRWVFTIACAASAWPLCAAADCNYPKAPESIPDGKTASEADMVAAMTVFKQYNNDVTAYLTCLDSDTTTKVHEAAGSDAVIVRIKYLQSKKHNSAVDELKGLAIKFNEQVRTFKSRK